MTDDMKIDDDRRMLMGALAWLGGSTVIGLAGCGGGGGGGTTPPQPTDTMAPMLAATSPTAEATKVSRATAVELTFSEPVTAATNAVTLTGPRGAIATVTAVSGAKITLTPTRPLGFGEHYTVTAGSGVHDAAGNAFGGISASFTSQARNPAIALGGIMMDTYVRRRWSDPASNPWNVLPALVDHGFEWLRVAVTTQSFPALRTNNNWNTLPFVSEYWSCLEVSGALLREGADLGMRLHAVLFLSHQAADWGRQALPPGWVGLSDANLALKVEQHATTVATYYRSLGLNIEVFEIGNEIDAGVLGLLLWDTISVPTGIDPLNDRVWTRDHLWARAAPLLRAAMRGVQSVYPSARIMLHVGAFGYSVNNVAADGFFQSMIDLGVPFDIAGTSFPYMYGGKALPQPYFAQPEFVGALDRIAALGKPIQIVEFGYHADPAGTQVTPAAAYPFTPDGQAAFVRDFAASVRGRVQSIFYFYPDWYEGFNANSPELEGMGLFSAAGLPRPALEVFNAIAESRLLA